MIKKNDLKQPTIKRVRLAGKIAKDEGKYETIIHYSTAGVEIYRERRIKSL